jgi:hypothetical protein
LPGAKITTLGLLAVVTRACGRRSLQRERFVDEHDWNPVADRVSQPAVVAYERRLRLAMFQLTTALGTHKHGQQAIGNRHWCRSGSTL